LIFNLTFILGISIKIMQTEYQSREYRGRKPSTSTVSADRVPPQALDVERTILGSMLIDSATVDIALEFLREDNFYSEAHAKIFICMRELSDKNSPVDMLSVAEKLRQKGWLEAVGAEGYLSELAGNVVTVGNMQYYTSILLEKSTLRQLISAAGEITTDCFSSDRSAQEVLDAAEGKIYGIAESRVKNRVESVGDLLKPLWEEINNFAKGEFTGVPTGFTKLDEMTTGLQKGDLVIIGGRPSMGKTAFCLSVALNASVRAGVPTAIFSLEMSKSALMLRMLCAEACVNMHSLRSGRLPKPDYRQLGLAAGPLSTAQLFIDDTSSITALELRAKARRLKSQHNLGLIIVDYLQLMSPNVKSDSFQQDIAQISRSLKAVAKELEVPVVALSQLSRESEKRTGKHRPQLSDLRDSGAIEQDADLVMFVYRDEVYNPESLDNRGKAEIIIGKQRNGPIGTADVAFIKDYLKFADVSERTDIPAAPDTVIPEVS